MRPEEEFGIIEGIEIVNGVAGAELDALDLLQIDEESLLLDAGHATVFDAGEGLLERVAELAVEQAGHGGIIYLIIARLGRIIHHLAAIYQQHELVVIYVDDRSIGYYAFRAFGIGAALITRAHGDAAGEHRGLPHIICFQNLQPLVRQAPAHGAHKRFYQAHMCSYLPYLI